jgi:hypothetical protein
VNGFTSTGPLEVNGPTAADAVDYGCVAEALLIREDRDWEAKCEAVAVGLNAAATRSARAKKRVAPADPPV